jgi:integrase
MDAQKQGRGKDRTWGTGSVSPKGPGKWLLRTSHRSLKGEDGTRERIRVNRVVRASSKREAEDCLAEMLTGSRAGGAAKPKRWALDDWFKHVYANTELAPRTRETALQAWDVYTAPAFKVLPLHIVTVDDVDRELDRLKGVTSRFGRPLAPRTRALWYANLRHTLNVAVKKRLIPANPALLTDRAPSSDRSTERPRWTAEETVRFLAEADADRLAALWRVLLDAGIRPGEAFALRWGDVVGDVLTPRRNLVRLKDGEVRYDPTKTHATKPRYLSVETVAALKSHQARQKRERFKAGRHYWAKLDLVFGNELGEPLRHDVVSRQYKRLAKAAKVPALHLYGLRHTSASLKDEAGVSPRTISEGLGHKDPGITMRYYIRSGEAQQRAAPAALSALLKRAAKPAKKA